MRRSVIAGNWKMNGSRATIAELLAGIVAGLESAEDGVDWLVFPPGCYLGTAVEKAAGSRLGIGIQDVHAEANGAHTGDIAAEMAADLGAAFAIVGHSERRRDHGEGDAMVALKFAAARRAGLTPVLCVGETLAERDADRAEAVVVRQLDAVAEAVGQAALSDALIAYEPVWAIGTGRTATPAQAQDMHAHIRRRLESAATRILYGGSVKPDNAGDLFAGDDIDGALIGGASLDADAFLAIGRAARTRL